MSQKRVVVVSGLAGAGKTTAARALEDLGFFVVDNLPPPLIETLIDLSDSSGGELRRIALVIDARLHEHKSLAAFGPTWDRLMAAGCDLTLLFLDCDDDILVRRFSETRRRHPLDDGSGVHAGIQKERAILDDLRQRADEVINTRGLSVHDLKRRITKRFEGALAREMSITVLSFGFKHGLPPELDLCFDVRFLPNPYFIERLRPQSGNDPEVRDYVLGHRDAQAFLQKMRDMTAFLIPRYRHEGKAYVTIAIGCTGGRHRSVALAGALHAALIEDGHGARVLHRDVDKRGKSGLPE